MDLLLGSSSTRPEAKRLGGLFKMLEKYIFQMFETFPLENPLEKSDDCVPLPINLFVRIFGIRPEAEPGFLALDRRRSQDFWH